VIAALEQLDERPTLIPAAWPSLEELCPVRAVTYPTAPNTDERATVRPGAAS
jgi:hypothetical protein